MLIDVTIRPKPQARLGDGKSHARPSQERVGELARTLEAAGLEVLREGRFGVSVRGDVADFQRLFGMNPLTKEASADGQATLAPLRELADAIEVVPKPLSFDR